MNYQLQQTGDQVQEILNQAPTTEQNLQSEITRSTTKDEQLETAIGNEKTRAEGVESNLQSAIGNEVTRAEGAESNLQTAIANEKTRAELIEGGLRTDVDAIKAEIPTQASPENQLADKAFVNSSIATNTAEFKGTYNSLEDLQTQVQDANANDYAFVVSTDAAGNTVYNRYKYVEGTGWVFEYALNNSSFTSAQWAAIQSGITAALVAKLVGLPTATELATQMNQIIASVTAEKTRAEGIESGLRTDVNANAAAIVAEKNRAEGVEGTLSTAIGTEKSRAEGAETILQQNIDAEALARGNADTTLQGEIDTINGKIPSQATASNQLADKAFVNSSIATNTADFKGTYNSLQELEAVTANNNDYGFVVSTDAAGNTVYNRYKYVEGTGWVFEYALNNSSFTSAQWAAIQSGITAALVTKLTNLPDNTALTAMFTAITSLIPSAASSDNKLVDYAQLVASLATKQDTLTFDDVPTQSSTNPVKSGGVYTAIATVTTALNLLNQSKQDKLTFDNTPTAGSDNPVKSQGIKSYVDAETTRAQNAESALSGRVTTAEGNITSLTGRMTTAEGDIETLRDLYNALQQSDPQVIEPTDTWPVANPSNTVIYRVIDRVNTPPEYYSDYMWNGTSMVLMATYNNAIDTTPKKDSANLITSGGVFANIGAFDVSEYHKSGGTLATYVDLSAALAAVPTDYQKGGMSVKFVQSSDNKYVQYRLMSDTFNTTVANWQGVDAEPTPSSKNLVDSNGVFGIVKDLGYTSTVTLAAANQNTRLSMGIPAGTKILSLGGYSYLNGRTNSSDATYQRLTDGVITDRDIYVVNGPEIGTVTITVDGLKEVVKENKLSIDGISSSILFCELKKAKIDSNSHWYLDGTHYMIPILSYVDEIKIIRKAGISSVIYGFIKNYDIDSNSVVFATGESMRSFTAHDETITTIPSDANYLYIEGGRTEDVLFNNISCFEPVAKELSELKEDIAENKDNIDFINDSIKKQEIELTFTANSGVNSIGNFTSISTSSLSNQINVETGDILFITSQAPTTGMTAIAKVDGGKYLPLLTYAEIGDESHIVSYSYVVREDCSIVISNYMNSTGKAKLIKTQSNIDKSVAIINGCDKTDDYLINSDNLFVGYDAQDNVTIDTSTGSVSAYNTKWATGYIPIDIVNHQYINANYPNDRILFYGSDKSFLGASRNNQAKPHAIDWYNNAAYVRFVFLKSVLSYENRFRLKLFYTDASNYNQGNKNIDTRVLGIKHFDHLTVNDLKSFAVTPITGTYNGSSFVGITPTTTDVYTDSTTKKLYRYDGTNYNQVGTWDNKSLIFTGSFALYLLKNEINNENCIVTCNAKYYGSSLPTIQFTAVSGNIDGWKTMPYTIGGNTGFAKKEWRAPELNSIQDKVRVDVTVPSGTTLVIDNISNYFSSKKGFYGNPRLNAHGNSMPDNTMAYFELAAKQGYSCIITIPKVTSDGVFVCMHDDDNINYARYENGQVVCQKVNDEYIRYDEDGNQIGTGAMPVSSLTYAQLMQYDFGLRTGFAYAGQKIPKVEDFFMLCAKTGVHPMFSVHPNLTTAQWQEIKAMAKKYNVLDRLCIKVAVANMIPLIYEVFGTDIESYTADYNNVNYSESVAEMLSIIESSSIDLEKVKVGMEYFHTAISEEAVQATIDAGMFAAYAVAGSNGRETSEDYTRWIKAGVSEITDDMNPSVGLNW